MSLNKKRILLVVTFLWAMVYLFVPIRKDLVTARISGTTPDNQVITPVHEERVSSIAFDFNGSPGGIPGILFFGLMPFFVVWQSFNFKRPFTLPGKAFLNLESLFLFLGAPYCYYMITYQQGNFYDSVHTTEMAWGGYLLCAQDILLSAFLFSVIANPKGKTGQFFGERV